MEWLLRQIDAKCAEIIQMVEPEAFNQGVSGLDGERSYYRKLEQATRAHHGLCKRKVSSLVTLKKIAKTIRTMRLLALIERNYIQKEILEILLS